MAGLAAVTLFLAGAILGLPVLSVLGLLLIVIELVHGTWVRRGLDGVRYRRHLAAPRLAWGEEALLDIEVWNRKPLPLAWLRADDAIDEGLVVRDRAPVAAEDGGQSLVNTWTLAPYERVVRHLHVTPERRGVLRIGPATLAVGDLFARQAATVDLDDETPVIVWPKVLSVDSVVRPERWGTLARARHGLLEDPSRFAGIRPYSPGDPIRRIHARASARLGQPLSKRFEPARERDLLIALDLQTVPGPAWALSFDDDVVESLFVVAASIAWKLAEERAAFGLTAAGYSGLPRPFADVPVSSAAGQAPRVLDQLARLSNTASAPFESLLARVTRKYSSGTTVLALSASPMPPLLRSLRHLARAGFGVAVLTAGPAAAANAAAAREAGFVARAAVLDGAWQTATTLSLT